MNLNFIFQGCQKLYVRVAISQKANKIYFQHINEIIVYMITYNATILLALVDFVSLDDIWAEVHMCRSARYSKARLCEQKSRRESE